MAHGFARAYCDECEHDFPIAYSCKGRGVCPSCNTRRMVETAAHLADQVFPSLPVRQWVLSVPKRLRYFLQTDAALQGAVPLMALDSETTGLDSSRDCIVSIGLVPMSLECVHASGSRHWILKPDVPLADKSVAIHGITESQVAHAPVGRATNCRVTVRITHRPTHSPRQSCCRRRSPIAFRPKRRSGSRGAEPTSPARRRCFVFCALKANRKPTTVSSLPERLHD